MLDKNQNQSWLTRQWHSASGNLKYDLFKELGWPLIRAAGLTLIGWLTVSFSAMRLQEIIGWAFIVAGVLWGLLPVVISVVRRRKQKPAVLETSINAGTQRPASIDGTGLQVLLKEGEALFRKFDCPEFIPEIKPGAKSDSPMKDEANDWIARVESELRKVGIHELVYDFGCRSDEAQKKLQPNPKFHESHHPIAEFVLHRTEQLKKILCSLPPTPPS